ncbi:succinate-semialdehyde dehydrogenase (NAD(P)(+)) [Citreicella sp. 357]|nr:succinate-semialdehyde dehydrogenase (NAD(P)(+)) [Citreicella sp. 357]
MTQPTLILNGEARSTGSLGTLPLIDPATEMEICLLPKAGRAEAEEAARLAAEGFAEWSVVSPFERGKILRAAAAIMRDQADEAAADMTREQGKPLVQARGEWMGSADCLDWFAEEGRRTYGRLIPSRSPDMTWAVHQRPVGPVAAFTPWNFPAWTPIQKIAPALAAGCSVVFKPAEETPITGWRIVRALLDAGLPPKALALLWGDPAEISDTLVKAAEIRKISLTGSTRVGRLLGGAAGQELKKVTMELGGHAPVIVARDADLSKVVPLAAEWKFRNAGQVCVSPTRFLVEAPLYDDFVSGMASAAEKITVGNGTDPATTMGPLATATQFAKIQELAGDAIDKGARVVAGGGRIGNRGWFFAPTVLADMTTEMRAMTEEPFGPLALVTKVDDLDAALAEANRIPVGLASYAFTGDSGTRHRIASTIKAGMLGINHFAMAMPETPFGGVLDSGLGSEGGIEGIHAYLTPFLVTALNQS